MGRASTPRMGLGAGGVMQQKIYPDPHGLEAWDPHPCGEFPVHILRSDRFREIVGHDPPPTPVDAAAYTRHGLPWFRLYDEDAGDIPKAASLSEARTVRERGGELGIPEDDTPLDITGEQVTPLKDPGTKDRPPENRARKKKP